MHHKGSQRIRRFLVIMKSDHRDSDICLTAQQHWPVISECIHFYDGTILPLEPKSEVQGVPPPGNDFKDDSCKVLFPFYAQGLSKAPTFFPTSFFQRFHTFYHIIDQS